MVSTDPRELVNDARCYDSCIPVGMRGAVIVYLQAIIAGLQDLTPSQLANRARCFASCIPPGHIRNVIAYQLLLNAGLGGLTVSEALNRARCYLSCVPLGLADALTIISLADQAGLGGTAPSALANAARCYHSCIPPGMWDAVWLYLLRPDADPRQLVTDASGFSGLTPGQVQTIVLYTEPLIGGEEGSYFGQPEEYWVFGEPGGWGFGVPQT